MLRINSLSAAIAIALQFPVMTQVYAAEDNSKVSSDTTTMAQMREDKLLEVITVTAQKRREKLSEVPISMSNFSAESITQTGVQQLKDISQFIPNFTMSEGTDFTSKVSIRGVGANSRNIGFDTRVGVYLDGVYLGQSPALNQALLDLERIEVLRGPQGTLFGKNTVAGAVNLISAKPSDEFSGEINTSFGNFNAREVSALVNIPLSSTLFSKISVSKQKRDGVTKNLITNHEINELDDESYRAQLFYVAETGNFEANLSFDGLKGARLSYTGEAVTDSFGRGLPMAQTDEFEVSMGVDPHEKRDIKGSSMTLDWDLDNEFSIKSISAYRESEIYYKNDVDYSELDFLQIKYSDKYKQLSQEMQLISPDKGAFKYVAGLYYYDQEALSMRIAQPGSLGYLLGVSGPVTTEGVVETLSYAFFMNGSYQLDDAWKLGFGFRYSREDKEVDWNIDGSDSGPAFGLATGSVLDERSDNHFSPTINLNYAFNSDINGYVKYSSGYKSGGYNLDFVSVNVLNSGVEFAKETVDSYEIGLKGDLFNRRLAFSLAGFQTYYDDYQVNQFMDLGDGGTAISIRNAAEVETKGVEAEVTYTPNEHWQVMASIGLLDGEFSDFPGGATRGGDASGKTIPGISDVSLSIGIQYYHPLPSIGAELLTRLDYSYRSDYYDTVDNIKTHTLQNGDSVPFGWVDNLSIVNARITLLSDEGTWDVAFWGKNLTDESYLSATNQDFLRTVTQYRGMPRTFGIEVSYNF